MLGGGENDEVKREGMGRRAKRLNQKGIGKRTKTRSNLDEPIQSKLHS